MSLLNLTCPVQQPGQDLLVETQFGELKRSIEDIPYGNIKVAQNMILDKLSKLNRISLASKDRYQILTLFQGPYHIIFDYFLDSLKRPNNKTSNEIPDDLKQLTQEMSYGYKILIREYSSNRSITTANQLVAEIFNLALSYLERLLIEFYLRYEHPPNYLWREVYQIYHYAEARGFHSKAITLKPVFYCAATIEDTFKRIALTSLTSPNQFQRGRLAHILDYLDKWCHKAQILGSDQVMSAIEESRKQAFLMDLSSDQKPSHAPTNLDEANLSALRLLDTSYLVYLLDNQTINLHSPAKLKELGMSANLTVRESKALLEEVASRWAEKLERCSERFPSNKYMDFVWGVPEIFKTLQEQEGFIKQSLGDNSEELSPPMLDNRFLRWQSVNISQGGLQLRHENKAMKDLAVGQIALSRVHGQDAKASWQLFVVRWLEETPKRGTNLGVESIVGSASTLKLTTISERNLEPMERPALLLSKPSSEEEQQTIITLTNAYYQGRKMEMELNGDMHAIVAQKQVEQTEHYARFTFEEAELIGSNYVVKEQDDSEVDDGNDEAESEEDMIEEEIILQDTSRPRRSRD